MGDWISVEDSLPEVPDCYLVFRRNFYGMSCGQITVCYWDGNNWFDNYHACSGQELYESVSHWMPLPEPPKGEAEVK